jgi:hypothetical protein
MADSTGIHWNPLESASQRVKSETGPPRSTAQDQQTSQSTNCTVRARNILMMMTMMKITHVVALLAVSNTAVYGIGVAQNEDYSPASKNILPAPERQFVSGVKNERAKMDQGRDHAIKMEKAPPRPNEIKNLGAADQPLIQHMLAAATNASNSPSVIPSFSPVAVPPVAPTSAAPSASPTIPSSSQPSDNPSSYPTQSPFSLPTTPPVPVPTPPSKQKFSVFVHVMTWLFFVGILAFGGYECYLHRSTILFMTTRMFSEIVFRIKECCNRVFRRNARDDAARPPATLNEILFEEDSQSLNQAELSERLLA